MARLMLIRHALAVVEADVPAVRWRLSPGGCEAARVLAARIGGGSGQIIAASDEVKAIETAEEIAEVIGGDITIDARLREVARPWVHDGYESCAQVWLTGSNLDGWEPQGLVVARMSEAIGDAMALADSVALVVGHGLAMTTFVTAVTGADPLGFWSDLQFPDGWWVDIEKARLCRLDDV